MLVPFLERGLFLTFAAMKRIGWIGIIVLLTLSACDATTREARRMVKRAEQLADTLPDSTARLIDSVLRMPASFSERERMDIALLQAEALFGCDTLSPFMDDDFFDDHATLSIGPELEYAANYFANKNQYDKAAHAALYSGFLQLHYEEKEAAMRSFKKAEQYGIIATDSLTIARAEYKMGELLYYDGMEQEALVMLKLAEKNMKNWHKDLALVKNLMAVCYMVQDNYESAEKCLQQSLSLAKKTHSEGVRQKALNNLAVLFRIQGEYEQALACLKQTMEGSDSNEQELLLYYLNMGKTFIAAANIDSAALYLGQLETLLQKADVKAETKASAYSILCQFTENQGDALLAEKYRVKREELLSEIIYQRQEQTIYRIQKQYDYESLQNEMNRKLIRKQRLITLIGIFAIIGLIALAISQIRLAKTRKQEAETKTNLFHFMQQNKELAQQSEEQKQDQIYLAQKHKESEQAYEDLLKEKQRYEQTASEYGEKLSLALKKEESVMLRLHLFLENQGDEELLKKLEKSVFGKQAHLDAMMENVDRLYPQLREIIKQENLGLDENEQLDVIMSYFNISRQDEALLLDKTTDMVDKIRNRSRKKIQSASEGNDWLKIK